MNDRVKMTVRWNRKLGQGASEPTGVGANRLRRKGLFKEKSFKLRVK